MNLEIDILRSLRKTGRIPFEVNIKMAGRVQRTWSAEVKTRSQLFEAEATIADYVEAGFARIRHTLKEKEK